MITSCEEQNTYKDVFRALKKLPKKAIKDGCETFVLNGMAERVMYDSCFVAMMFDKKPGMLDNIKHSDMPEKYDSYVWPAVEKFKKYITEQELETVSNAHFAYPEIVFLAACDVINA